MDGAAIFTGNGLESMEMSTSHIAARGQIDTLSRRSVAKEHRWMVVLHGFFLLRETLHKEVSWPDLTSSAKQLPLGSLHLRRNEMSTLAKPSSNPSLTKRGSNSGGRRIEMSRSHLTSIRSSKLARSADV